MGCGASIPDSPSNQVEYYDHVKMAPNGTGTVPMPAVAEEVSVNILEQAKEAPKPREEGSFVLPEGDFVDGRLGIILNSAAIADIQEEESAIETLKGKLAVEELFCDEDFPADNSSIFFSEREETGIEWKRPSEIISEPKLFVDGASRRDVVQGKLGDCWFLSSCAAVARKPKLIERVVPPNQHLYGEEYSGLVVCRFWRFGEWVSVCVDDRLPTKDGEILFARSSDPTEFWVAILEKAYAKLHGSYEAMEGGQSMDAMVDLTGGLAERYDMEDTEDKNQLYKLLLKSSQNGAFITSSRKGDWKMATKADEHGLVEGHAYTVSGVARVRHETLGTVKLLRVRNPWANEAEWNGDWGDSDEKWDGISDEQKTKLGFHLTVDGEFWMCFDDFCGQFEEVSVCTIGPDFDHDGTVDYVGQVKAIKGEWVVGESAGGSRNDFEKFATNPQYLLTITEPDDDDENEGRCSVLIGLLQEHRRSLRSLGVKMIQIGFVIYKTDDPENRLPSYHFHYHYEEGTSGTYINFREVLARQELEPGHYVIIPATFLPDTPGHFMVRVYSPKPFELAKLD
ncbi:calpain-A-like isoform X1 [Macrobrachium nipponense]|uniref:calpain-A-like isoform X1 n=1 Tax=Macrobrachium nipponense TaxID=159736 RepID=UPI0030C8D32B